MNGSISRPLAGIFGGATVAGLSESELLERFVHRRDEVAFEAIVTRHGPMVLGVCRRILHDPSDVDDAFQATFLILVKNAGKLRDGDRLSSWLYGVAYRVATRARGDASRKRGLNLESFPEPIARDSASAPEIDEVFGVLDRELRGLSEKYRAPLILCYLEGRSHEQAAAQLNWPVGTVRGRLFRGRELLKGRLMRRGIAPASAGIALACTTSLRASVAESLVGTTVKAAIAVLQGSGTAAGIVSAMSLALVHDHLRLSIMTKVGIALVTAVAVGMLGGMAFAAKQGTKSAADTPSTATTQTEAKQAPNETQKTPALKPLHVVQPGDRLQIEVLEALPGRPISGMRVVRPDGTISLEFYGDLKVVGLNRHEIKTKVVEHLRKYLTDDTLGLQETDVEGKKVRVDPADSDRVFVDDGPFPDQLSDRKFKSLDEKLNSLESKLDRVLHLMEQGRSEKVEPNQSTKP